MNYYFQEIDALWNGIKNEQDSGKIIINSLKLIKLLISRIDALDEGQDPNIQQEQSGETIDYLLEVDEISKQIIRFIDSWIQSVPIEYQDFAAQIEQLKVQLNQKIEEKNALKIQYDEYQSYSNKLSQETTALKELQASIHKVENLKSEFADLDYNTTVTKSLEQIKAWQENVQSYTQELQNQAKLLETEFSEDEQIKKNIEAISYPHLENLNAIEELNKQLLSANEALQKAKDQLRIIEANNAKKIEEVNG
jgi:chromosome segregation ATPase